MNSSILTPGPTAQQTTTNPARRWSVWLPVLVLCNLSLLRGAPATALVFFPDAVAAGQWWRVFTAPFVHVGWYHLLLDGAAFLLLWQELAACPAPRRLSYLAGAWAGSLLLPLWVSPQLAALGLCGLSGISHGLTAVTALELCRRSDDKGGRLIGAALLSGLTAKCAWELAIGSVLLAGLHLGPVGTPIVATHAGGLAGGVLVYLLERLISRSLRQRSARVGKVAAPLPGAAVRSGGLR